jgi:CheY-like chemotaxis protein
VWACQAAGDLPTGDHPLVLCVDDDEVNHLVLEGMLQSQSYR